jgi:hypothetical protein
MFGTRTGSGGSGMTGRCRHFHPAPFCFANAARQDQLPQACASCDRYDGPRRGVGDIVYSVLASLKIGRLFTSVSGGNCGCGRRRAILNRILPFRKA